MSKKKVSLKEAMAGMESSKADERRDKRMGLKEGSKKDTALDNAQANKAAAGKNAAMKMSRIAMKRRKQGK